MKTSLTLPTLPTLLVVLLSLFVQNVDAHFDDYYWRTISQHGQENGNEILGHFNYRVYPEFDPNNPKNNVQTPFTNWENMDDQVYVPEVAKEITTFGGLQGSSQNGIQRLIKNKKYIYSPVAKNNDGLSSAEYTMTGFEELEFRVFDLTSLQHRTLQGPNLAGQDQYSLQNDHRASAPYKGLNFTLSPSGQWAARLFSVKELATSKILDALIVWNPETGDLNKIVFLPDIFEWDCSSGYCHVDNRGSSANSIETLIPSNPFFTTESDLYIPFLYVHNDSQKFFFQPVQIDSKEVNWRFEKVGYEIKINDSVISFEIKTKISALCGLRDYYQFQNSDHKCEMVFPTFSVQKMVEKNQKIEAIVAVGRFFTIMANSTFGSNFPYPLKDSAPDHSLEYYSLDGQKRIGEPTTGSTSIPSFYPSVYVPYGIPWDMYGFPYRTYTGRDQSQLSGTGSNTHSGWSEGIEVNAAWEDAALPPGYRFATLTSVKYFKNRADGFGFRIQTLDQPVNRTSLTNEKFRDTFISQSLNIIKMTPKNAYKPTGSLKCQVFSDLNVELCSSSCYPEKDSTKLYSGNLQLKDGTRVLLNLVDFKNEGDGLCSGKVCYKRDKMRYDGLMPGTNNVKIKVEYTKESECNLKNGSGSCRVVNFIINGHLQVEDKEKDDQGKEVVKYPLDILK